MERTDLAGRARRAGLIAFVTLAATGAAAGSALANPTIDAVYDPAVAFSAADKAVIADALAFYATNMTTDFTMTVAIGAHPAGGGGSQAVGFTSSYNAYYDTLAANSSGGATDVAAIASLGGGAHVNNPVTGTNQIGMTSTLAAVLGLAAPVSVPFASCGGVTANACIIIGLPALNIGGAPLAGLNRIVQHEFDDVLGVSSALAAGFLPNDPDAADLYRYAAPGVRSFALNTSSSVPCSGSPSAYFSVNGGATNAQSYNNCNNGGDYGGWIGVDGKLVQDAFGPDTQAAALKAGSPEVKLLDAIGYNFSFAPGGGVPEPATWALMLLGLASAGAALRARRSAAPRG